MGGPTWPPTPEIALKETRKAYGDTESHFLDPERFESEWLNALLSSPSFQPQVSGESLYANHRYLKYWMILSGIESLPIVETELTASQNHEMFFLPSTLPLSLSDSRNAWKIMLIVQGAIRQVGLHRNKPLLSEIHSDWSLRQHLLILLAVAYRNKLKHPWSRISNKSYLSEFTLGQTRIPDDDIPIEIKAYANLPLTSATITLPAVFTDAVKQVTQAHPRLLLGIVQNEAMKCLEWMRQHRLGVPPTPLALGTIRPAWIDNSLQVNKGVTEAWRSGPKPLRLLNRILKRKSAVNLKDVPPSQQKSIDVMGNHLPEWNGQNWLIDFVHYQEISSQNSNTDIYERIISQFRQEAESLKSTLEIISSLNNRRFQSVKGDEIDIDAFIRSRSNFMNGQALKENWYIEKITNQQWPTITILIDETGSAHYHFQQVQQQAMALLSFATQNLNLKFEVWGFSGNKEKHLTLKCFKTNECHPNHLAQTLTNLGATGGSRLGSVIRWQSKRPSEKEHLVLWFSDLVAEDGQSYKLDHARKDLWMAIQELRSQGQTLHNIDFSGRIDTAYAQKLLGEQRYTRVSSISQFPSLFCEILLQYLVK